MSSSRSRGDELVRAIRAVGAGQSLLDPAVTKGVLDRLRKGKHLIQDEKLARLSPRRSASWSWSPMASPTARSARSWAWPRRRSRTTSPASSRSWRWPAGPRPPPTWPATPPSPEPERCRRWQPGRWTPGVLKPPQAAPGRSPDASAGTDCSGGGSRPGWGPRRWESPTPGSASWDMPTGSGSLPPTRSPQQRCWRRSRPTSGPWTSSGRRCTRTVPAIGGIWAALDGPVRVRPRAITS